jgi:hypothetical protein
MNSPTAGAKVKVENIHYELGEEELMVRGCHYAYEEYETS